METAVRVQTLRRLGVAVVLMTFALMVLGSWVKATGSGLACPDWPACYGEWLPPFPSAENGGTDPDGLDSADSYTQAQVLYEWTHRLVAALLGIPLLAFTLLAATGRDLHKGLRWLPVWAGGVLLVQFGLGGVTVLGQNAAPLTTAHLATATLFFFLVTSATAFAFLRPTPTGRVQPAVRRVPGQVKTVFPGEERP